MPTKTEDSKEYHAKAYAYVPDRDTPSTWKLRLEETPGNITVAQLGRAAAAFSPGGFRGQRVQIPAAAVGRVKARIRSEYRKLGVKPTDMPNSVQETSTASTTGKPKPYHQKLRVLEFHAAGEIEALADGDFRVEFLAHGATDDRARYYPKEALQAAAAAGVFDSAKMFLNHQDDQADKGRGHRDVRDWAGTIKPGSVRFVNGNLQAVCHAHQPEALSFLKDPVAKAAVGISHDSYITTYPGTIDGRKTQVVESIDSCVSVDFVPAGNAHGRVIETVRTTEEANDMAIEDLTLETLDSDRADLVDAITKRAQEAAKDDVTKAATEAATAAVEAYKAQQVKEAEATKAAAEKEAEDKAAEDAKSIEDKELEKQIAAGVAQETKALQETVDSLRTNEAKRTVLDIVDQLLSETEGLSEVGLARVRESFVDVVVPAAEIPQKVSAAVEAQRKYDLDLMKEAGVATQVTGAGATHVAEAAAEATEKYRADLEERFRDTGMSEEDIKQYMDVK